MAEIVDLRPEFKELINFSANDAAIEKFKEHLELRVCGFSDGEGYALCKEARKEVSKALKTVETQRETFKKPFWDAGKAIDAEAKRLKAPLEEIKSHLTKEIKTVDDEKKRRAEEQKQQAIERESSMKRLLAEVEAPYSVIEECVKFDDDTFEEVLGFHEMEFSRKKAEAKKQAEHLRKLEEEAAKVKAEAEKKERIEREKQEAVEAENRKLRAQIEEAKQRELDAERKRVEAAEAAQRKAEEEKEAALEAARLKEVERLEAEEKKEQEALITKMKAEKEAADKAADKELFESVKAEFGTIQMCWVEICRLRKLVG